MGLIPLNEYVRLMTITHNQGGFMNKALLLTLLISCPISPKDMTPKEQYELKQQEEKDAQELKLKLIATFGTIALAIIAAYVQVYLGDKK